MMRPRNKLIPVVAASLLVFCGCAGHYVIKLNGGGQITTNGKPKLKGGAYYYKDSRGQERYMPAGRVAMVEPASMAEEEAKQAQFKPQSQKKKHWYWPF